MELAYIYIQNHKALVDLNIPIKGSHKCNFSSGKLTLEFLPSELDYYKGLNCSAIIGKNGVGKSTILDFLEVAYSGTDSSGIIVWFDNTIKKYHICTINLYINDSSVVSDKDYVFDNDFIRFTKRHKIKLIKANNLTGVENNDFSIKKKSNSFIYDMSLSQYVNGSRQVIAQRTNRLIRYFDKSSFFNKLDQPKVQFIFQFSTSSTAYLKSLLSNEEFVAKNIQSKHDLNLLHHLLDDRLSRVSLYEYQNIASQLLRANILSICNVLSKLSIIRKKDRDYFFIQLVIYMMQSELNVDFINNLFRKLIHNSEHDSAFKDIYKYDGAIVLLKYQTIMSSLGKISHFIHNIIGECEIFESDKLSTFNSELIIELTSIIASLPSLMLSNFKYGWNGFSTGEFAKLNIFSELYNYIHDQKTDKFKNHLIVMDEVDLYLHPDWQRTFFSELLEFIRIEFPKDSVQIILSTHSPIIVSDFLPEDIVSLDRSNGKTNLIESFGFASHITDLYIEGMHLSSTFGEHSKKAINQLLTHANKGVLTEEDLLLIKKIKSQNIQDMLLGNHDKN